MASLRVAYQIIFILILLISKLTNLLLSWVLFQWRVGYMNGLLHGYTDVRLDWWRS
jgi:hypothetical protein